MGDDPPTPSTRVTCPLHLPLPSKIRPKASPHRVLLLQAKIPGLGQVFSGGAFYGRRGGVYSGRELSGEGGAVRLPRHPRPFRRRPRDLPQALAHEHCFAE